MGSRGERPGTGGRSLRQNRKGEGGSQGDARGGVKETRGDGV